MQQVLPQRMPVTDLPSYSLDYHVPLLDEGKDESEGTSRCWCQQVCQVVWCMVDECLVDQ